MNEICSICKEKYDIYKRKPMVLQCGHTQCYSCLYEMWQKLAYIKCNIDQKKHFQNLESFQVNHYLMDILQPVKKVPSPRKSVKNSSKI